MIKNNFFALSAAALALGALGLLTACTPSTPDKVDGGGTTPTNPPVKKPDTAKVTGRPATTGPGVTVTGDTIKLGLVASLNGDQKPWGEDSKKGAELIVKQINDAGGIKGKKVELDIQDSASSPDGAKSAAVKLASDGVVAIVGEVSSGNTEQIINVAHEKGLPVVGIGCTRTDLSEMSNCFYRVCYTDDFQGPVMAKFAWDALKLKKVALFTDQKLPYSTGLSTSFATAFKKLGGEIVDEEKYESGQANFSGLVGQVKGKTPDGLFCSGYFNEVGGIAKAVRGAGMNEVKLMGGDGWDSPSLITGGGDAIIGGFFCNHYSIFDTRPEVQDFLTKWKAANGGTLPGTTMGALTYDATRLACDALNRATELSSAAMIKALDETENFKGVSGNITLKGGKGNPIKPALVVQVTKDGFKPAKTYQPSDIPLQ